MEDLIRQLETVERGKVWIYVSCDREEDGSLTLVNATGFYPDEISAGLAGETFARDWNEVVDDGDPPVNFPVPLFIEQPLPADAD